MVNINPNFTAYRWDEIIYNPRSSFGPRIQEHYQLVLVHRGRADIRVDGEWLRVEAGEVALLLPGREERFRFSEAEPTHHSWIHAEFSKGADPWPTLSGERSAIVPMGDRLAWIMDQLLHGGLPTTGPGNGLGCALAEAAFHDVFLRANLLVEKDSPGHPAVARARNFMEDNLSSALDLGAIARQAGLSPQHLSRLYRAATGFSPIEHLWCLREETGRRLLRETGLTVAEVADACGFQNPFHFSRRMRQRYGASPRLLRKRDWGTG
jgi:AraC-like DNA-binding protein